MDNTNHSTQPHIVTRPYHRDPDYGRVRELLIETYPITPTDFNWEIRRWDGWHTHRTQTDWKHGWEQRFRLWETENGQLVGAVHPEGDGEAFLELHPDYRRLIEEDMVAWAEAHLAVPAEEGPSRRLDIFVPDYNSPRRRLLERRGFVKMDWSGVTRRLRFGNAPLPEPIVADGYAMRTTRPNDFDDCQRLADVLNAGFNRPGFHTADEYHNFVTQSPSFRHDLNLVAEAPDGSFAAHVGVTYEDRNRYGIFEPVCTHPAHRRKGLARSLMFEGLRRLKALGALDVYVGTGDAVAANELYESVGFTEAYKGYVWRKTFQP